MASREELYAEVVRAHGAALDRLARAYEADPGKCGDLLQDIHLALWQSLERFDGRCSLRTWLYRVGHNVAASHVANDRRTKSRMLISIEDVDLADAKADTADSAERNIALDRLMALIRELKPSDRQLVLLFLEGVDATGIADVTGMSAGNVATRIHRIKNILTNRFQGRKES
jgi:RNA polymerase sigma-70 factor (ECF subfamily)